MTGSMSMLRGSSRRRWRKSAKGNIDEVPLINNTYTLKNIPNAKVKKKTATLPSFQYIINSFITLLVVLLAAAPVALL